MKPLALASAGLLLAALASAQAVPLPCSTLTSIGGCIECMGATKPQRCYLCSHKHLPVYDRGIIKSVSDMQDRGLPATERRLGCATCARLRCSTQARSPSTTSQAVDKLHPLCVALQCKAASFTCGTAGPRDPNCMRCDGASCLRCKPAYALNADGRVRWMTLMMLLLRLMLPSPCAAGRHHHPHACSRNQVPAHLSPPAADAAVRDGAHLPGHPDRPLVHDFFHEPQLRGLQPRWALAGRGCLAAAEWGRACLLAVRMAATRHSQHAAPAAHCTCRCRRHLQVVRRLPAARGSCERHLAGCRVSRDPGGCQGRLSGCRGTPAGRGAAG